MLLELTEERQLIKDTAREFAEKTLEPMAAQIDREEKIPQEIISKLAELGFWGIVVPEEYNGAGLDTVSLCLVLEQISHACASTSVTLSVHNSLVCNAIVKYGTPEQKKKYLPRLAKGEIIGAFAMTEPETGSDAASLHTRAKFENGKYLLNGIKSFVSSGPFAGLFIVFARTHPDAELKSKGISAFIVEPDLPGVKRGLKESKMGIRGAPLCEMSFEDVVLTKDNILGKENGGFAIAMETLNCGRIGIAIQSVGIAQASLDLALKYAKERKQFGKTLSEFQMIKWKFADMATEIEASRLLAYQAAILRDKGMPYTKEASMAKLFASAVANRAAKESLQIHGGVGYTKEFAIERFFRDAKATEIYEGTSEIQRLVIDRFL
jgi:alkylation response protein AidB-like acyl-CoA dehydrogenase